MGQKLIALIITNITIFSTLLQVSTNFHNYIVLPDVTNCYSHQLNAQACGGAHGEYCAGTTNKKCALKPNIVRRTNIQISSIILTTLAKNTEQDLEGPDPNTSTRDLTAALNKQSIPKQIIRANTERIWC